MIYLSAKEAQVYEAYKRHRSLKMVAAELKRHTSVISATCSRLRDKGLLDQPIPNKQFIVLDKPYKVGKEPKKPPTKKPGPLDYDPPKLKHTFGSACGPCITTYISDYPEEEQRRMMSLFRVDPVKSPITTIGQDVAKQRRRNA